MVKARLTQGIAPAFLGQELLEVAVAPACLSPFGVLAIENGESARWKSQGEAAKRLAVAGAGELRGKFGNGRIVTDDHHRPNRIGQGAQGRHQVPPLGVIERLVDSCLTREWRLGRFFGRLPVGGKREIQGLAGAQRTYASIAQAIRRFEPVRMVAEPHCAQDARDRCGADIEIIPLPIDDPWMRDSGPTFLTHANGTRCGTAWRFNSWGG